jgi:hypothetical protein
MRSLVFPVLLFVFGCVAGAASLAAYALITVPASEDACRDELNIRPRFRNLLRTAFTIERVSRRTTVTSFARDH